MKKPPSSKPSYFYSILSVTLVLFLLGLFGLLVVQGRQFVKALKEEVEIIVEMKEEATPGSVDTLKQLLAQSDFFKPGSDRFISKEEGAAMMQEEFGADFLKLDMANPLFEVVTFNVKEAWAEPDSLKIVREQVRVLGAVHDAYFQEGVTDAIANNLKKISWYVLAAGIFFFFVAVALILSTIKLALYANRFLIKNMELVGASWGFISRPYLARSFRHGLLAALLAILALTGLLYFIYCNAVDWEDEVNMSAVGFVFLALLALGLIITITSTWYVVNKYLRMRVDDLY